MSALTDRPTTTADPDLVALLDDIFTTYLDDRRPPSAPIVWDQTLWHTLTELGLSRLTGREDSGGSGAGWIEAAALLHAAASAGVPTPYVEHDLLAGWLLDTAGLPVDDARRSACIVDDSGIATGVGWADAAERIVILHPAGERWAVSDVTRAEVAVTPGTNRAGEPRDCVAVTAAAVGRGVEVAADTAAQFRMRGALARAIQVSGAMEAILDASLMHTTARTQFGRPLSRFQAVQHAIADIAAETALARTTTESAVVQAETSDWKGSTAFLIAVARSCVGHASSVAVRSGHQVHGAIGTTREHRLHEFTRPALAWRSEFGSVASWDRVVADAALSAGSNGLWPLIAG